MTSNERTVWGIHAGATGDADKLFLQSNCIALGWAETGDLSSLSANRDAFKALYASVYTDSKAGAIPVNAGQLYRFVHELREGDLVVYPSKRDRNVCIGEVTGAYRFDRTVEPKYPHRRPIKWLRTLPRTHFTQGALYSVGSAMSFFQIAEYAEEFGAASKGKAVIQPVPVSKDETIALVAEEIEQITRDFILKSLAQELKGHPFSHFVARLLVTMGYRTRVSPPGPDGGIDIIAHKDELGFEPPIIKVQVKSGEETVGAPAVQALYGNIEGNNKEYGLFVTLGTFTSQALAFARSKSNLRLIDGTELVNLVLQHYEEFDSPYKGLLPLKRVYIPEVVHDEDNE